MVANEQVTSPPNGARRRFVAHLADRKEWQFFAVLPRAHTGLAVAWWAVVAARAALPAVFAIVMGRLVGAISSGADAAALTPQLAAVGAVFIAMQVLTPVHQAISGNLGDHASAWLYDELTSASVTPPGIGHLEDPDLAGDMTLARDFDLGMQGPPLSLSMDFIADGLVELLGGLACAIVLFGYAWWAPLALGGAWLATHWLLRESGVWRDRNTQEVRSAQQEAEYTYRLAVEAPAAKEVRLFGLADWVIERFASRRRRLHRLQYEATRLRERPVLLSLVLVVAANIAVFATLAAAVFDGRLSLGQTVTFAQAAIGASAIAFGGFNWALDSAAAPVAAVLRLRPAAARAGSLPDRRLASLPTKSGLTDGSGGRGSEATPRVRVTARGLPQRELRLRDVTFGYPGPDSRPILHRFNLSIPAGSSLAIVGRNGAGKTTLAKLICRLYDPQSGSIEADGVDIRDFDIGDWRSRVTAVFQDFIRFELPLRDNVAPLGGDDETIRAALRAAGADGLAALDTILSKGYDGGTDLSGGQWQRIALARAIAAVRAGAGVVLLDEPTAQLDARGEAEIFSRILAETSGCTTVLISHRFSTVRQADRICVVEDGAVVELGSHDELMALRGRYRTMFDLQARRFDAGEPEEEGVEYDVLG